MSDTTEKLQNIEGNKCRATMYLFEVCWVAPIFGEQGFKDVHTSVTENVAPPSLAVSFAT